MKGELTKHYARGSGSHARLVRFDKTAQKLTWEHPSPGLFCSRKLRELPLSEIADVQKGARSEALKGKKGLDGNRCFSIITKSGRTGSLLLFSLSRR